MMPMMIGTNLPNRTPAEWYRTRGMTAWKVEALNTKRRTSANVPTGGKPGYTDGIPKFKTKGFGSG